MYDTYIQRKKSVQKKIPNEFLFWPRQIYIWHTHGTDTDNNKRDLNKKKRKDRINQ